MTNNLDFISCALTRWKLLDFVILSGGTHRKVYLIGQYAFKRPIMYSWRLFLCGLLANLQEISFSEAGWPELCPVVFNLPGGWLNVMHRAKPLTDKEWTQLDFQEFADKDDYYVPVENKRDSFGTLNGKIVAVDYGS